MSGIDGKAFYCIKYEQLWNAELLFAKQCHVINPKWRQSYWFARLCTFRYLCSQDMVSVGFARLFSLPMLSNKTWLAVVFPSLVRYRTKQRSLPDLTPVCARRCSDNGDKQPPGKTSSWETGPSCLKTLGGVQRKHQRMGKSSTLSQVFFFL